MPEVSSSNHPAIAVHLELCTVLVIIGNIVIVTYLNGRMGTGFLELDRVPATISPDR